MSYKTRLPTWIFYYVLSLTIAAANFGPLLVNPDPFLPQPKTIYYLVISYILSLPLLIEFFLDYLVQALSSSFEVSEPKIGYFLLLVSLFLPVFLVSGPVEGASSSYSILFINCFVSFLQSLVIVGQYDKLQFKSDGHWHVYSCLIILFFFVSSQVCLNLGVAYSPAHVDDTDFTDKKLPVKWCVSAALGCGLFSLLLHCYYSKKYLFSILGDRSHIKECSANECAAVMLQCIAFTYFVVNLGVCGFFLFDRYDFDEYINVGVLTHIVLGLCAAILPGRVVRQNYTALKNALAIKGTFIRYVSHEIRSPLSTTSLGLNYLMDKLHANEISLSEVLDVVQESVVTCELAMNTLNDFLMLDKIQSNMLEISTTARQASEFMVEAIRPFSLQAASASITLICNVESFDGKSARNVIVDIDSYKMNQVMRNLLSNAFKFTPNGGTVTATMTVHEYSCEELRASDVRLISGGEKKPIDNHCMVRYAVKDSGCGISPENLPKLFGQYVQFNAAKLQGGKGSGLGLWLSKAVVEMHGGRIGATSEGEGKGCTFWFELPCVLSEEDKAATAANDAAYTGADVGAGASQNQFRRASSFVSQTFSMYYSPCHSAKVAPTSHSSDIMTTLSAVSSTDRPFVDLEKCIEQEVKNDEDNGGAPGRSIEDSDFSTEGAVVIREKKGPSAKHLPPPSAAPGVASHKVKNHSLFPVKKLIDLRIDATSSYKSKLSLSMDGSTPSSVASRPFLKVLLVDDSAIARKMVERSLAAIHAVCTHARTGTEAVEKVQQAAELGTRQYDVILMDHHMPEMSGPQAVEVLRSKLGYTGIIMGVSGNASTDTEFDQLMAAEKIDKVMVKPFNLDAFVDFMKNRMQYNNSHSQLPFGVDVSGGSVHHSGK